MDGSGISKTEKDKYLMFSLIFQNNLKLSLIFQRPTIRETVTDWEDGWEKWKGGVGEER
jgi:hypothetical protein